MAMTPRERMLTAYRRGMPDRVPVSPELWDATAIAVRGRPWHELVGPFAQVPWWHTHLHAFEYFDCDAWIVVGPGESPQQKEMHRTRSRFVDRETIETAITYRTPHGALAATARTTNVYADWLIEHPVKRFPQDMEAYASYYLTDPATYDLQEIGESLAGVGEKGLVTPLVGELFTSFLGTVREGGMVQTLYDIQDHPDYIKRLQSRYIEDIAERTRLILENTAAQAIFVNSNYSGPPIVSPRIYREWDKPVLQAVAAVCRRYDVPLHLHQHGHLLAVIEDIIEAGVSLVCPLLPPPQGDVRDLAEVKRRFGERIALKGNVDPIRVLLEGTLADVRSAVRDCLQAAAVGGSYILGTADSTVIGTPFENIHAFVETGKKYGQYL
jgi:uroporphyrinogen decarboxylase